MKRALEVIFEALLAKGYSREESEMIIAKFLEEEAEAYLESITPEA